jgi:hypothetical protein
VRPGLTVVTGWSPKGYGVYGKRFAESFQRHMPPDVDLIVYGEEPVPLPRGEFRPLYDIPGVVEFIGRHGANDAVRGLDVQPHWKERAITAGYNWKYDAFKFFRQGLIPLAAAAECETDHLAWFDGDVVFRSAAPPSRVIVGWLPGKRALAHLGRHPKWSEIGFQLYRVPDALPVLIEFSDLYTSDRFLALKEHHSAFVFDAALMRFPQLVHDMTPGGRGDVWRRSPLWPWSDHLKGDRKYK